MTDEAPRLQVPRRGRGRPGLVAWLSCLVTVLLILGQASALLHFILVPHRFCLVHGLEDVHVLDGAALRTTAAETPPDKKPAARAPADVISHERCALAMLVHERLACLPSERGVEIAAPASTGLVHPARDEGLLPSRRELAFAPKIGPPA